ncbi:LysR substrate-binding domain-containing protein [Undibacterium fentianense]|uniref:LysR family transcriptional regulator n=1 Tax=Undibacterium fentianense TaxID=2828728 RepID=A0A941IDL1_9BURK|nr:LysR substrate-binding domain-containing protein [Undibacterium fentianense]MBR7801439.1 LysR family transcriptional regulator [Undibacterium fentianense]
MHLQQIRYFLALAEEQHFWKTSEKVFITQSALSRHIKSMEEELGFALFERDKRNVNLTPAGEFLRDHYGRLLSEFESVTRRASQIAKGEVATLRIGHPASITFSILPDLLLALHQQYPQIAVQMFEVDAADVDPFLQAHRIDIAFNRESAKARDLISRPLMHEHFALVVPEQHRYANKRSLQYKDLLQLRDEVFVLPALTGNSEHASQVKAVFEAAGFDPLIRVESDFGVTLLGLVSKGLGISVMPISYSHHLNHHLKFIPLPATSSLLALWRAQDTSPALQIFLGVMEQFDFRMGLS